MPQPTWFATAQTVFNLITKKDQSVRTGKIEGNLKEFWNNNNLKEKRGKLVYKGAFRDYWEYLINAKKFNYEQAYQAFEIVYNQIKIPNEQDKRYFVLWLFEFGLNKYKTENNMAQPVDLNQLINNVITSTAQVWSSYNTSNTMPGNIGINPPQPNPLDLNDYITLPNVNTGLDQSTKQMVYLGIGALVLVMLFKK